MGLLTPCPERTLASMNAERFRTLRRVLDLRQPDLTVLMEEVHKPHNFAAILRTCDAVGVLRAHLVTGPDGEPPSRHIASGSSKWVQVEHHTSIEGAIRFLKGEGFRLLVAHPNEGATDYREVDFTRPSALLVGQELDGVTERALQGADELVSIPMTGMVGSLNVSVATALLLYEARQQRMQAGMYEESRLSSERYQHILFEWAHPKVAANYRSRGEPYPALSPEGDFVR